VLWLAEWGQISGYEVFRPLMCEKIIYLEKKKNLEGKSNRMNKKYITSMPIC